jgi:hypothetical protein
MRTKLTAAAVLAAAAATLAAAAAAGPVTHFARVPADGVRASTPTTGRLVVGLSSTATTDRSVYPDTTEWNVYADGRIIWQKWTQSGDATVVPGGTRRLATGYVQQRLTLQGVQLLRSKILATGLFEHNLNLKLRSGAAWVFHRVRVGDRMVTVAGLPSPGPSSKRRFTATTPAQTRALAWIAALVADPGRWLPASVWADRRIRAFVPACYAIAVDKGYPDLSKLPPPAGKALSQYKRLRRNGDQVVTTRQARALLQAFVKAGISPLDNHAWNIGFDFHGLGLPHPSYLHLRPVLPDRCF